MTINNDHKADKPGAFPRYLCSLRNVNQLSMFDKSNLKPVTDRYAFRANKYYLNLINWDDPDDPIRRLIIPCEEELEQWGELDACDESSITVRQGVQHKYATTVLLLVTENCGCFCRYCFRKRIFMNGNKEAAYDLKEGLEYISRHPEVNNVLLTGGDPMVLPTRKLRKIFDRLKNIKHVRLLRIGTKMPAFYPFRFLNDPEFINIIREFRDNYRSIYIVCHFDHPNELTRDSRKAIRMLQRAGAIYVNQNPIIRGVSDSPEVMSKLWNELSYIGVQQYYTFQGRPTAGNKPFSVPITEAYYKVEEAKGKCSGLAKRARYVMSHTSGKVEVMGVDRKYIYLKYHRAKDDEDEQRIIVCYRDDDAYWLDDLTPVPEFQRQERSQIEDFLRQRDFSL